MNCEILVKELVSNIRKYSKGKIYLFGSSLRNFLLSGKNSVFDIIVDEKDKIIQENILGIFISNVTFNFIFSSEIDYSHEFYTIDNIYTIIDEDFNGNLEIYSTNNGLVDLNKKIIKLTKAGKSRVESPGFIIDTITLASENGFILDFGTISAFMKNKSTVKDVEPRKICNFIKSIVGYKHPRKIISLINTLGISKELFDIKLTETSYVNHLRADDYYEFAALIFTDIAIKDLRNILIGFSLNDIDVISNIMEAISFIDCESDVVARNILNKIKGNRVQNMIRLLNAMKFKTLAKLVRTHQNNVYSVNKLCIDENIIKSTFKISDDNEVNKLLDKALRKVILDPSYNDKYKILTYLNNERE
jgi:hypothetical protein